MIEIRDLHLSLVGGAGPVNILRGVNLSVQSGETISIVGPSGAGKTTLLMALSGLERPSSGQVKIADMDLTTISEDDLARFRRRHVGIVFQSFHLVLILQTNQLNHPGKGLQSLFYIPVFSWSTAARPGFL